MPTIPTTVKCAMLGCQLPRSKLNTNCLEHGGKNYSDNIERRLKNNQYSRVGWSKIRIRQLSTQPLCMSCLGRGRVSLATDVDHVFPWSAMGGGAFTHNVFQSLCRECHSTKTGLEQDGIFRHYTTPPVDYSEHDYASVVV